MRENAGLCESVRELAGKCGKDSNLVLQCAPGNRGKTRYFAGTFGSLRENAGKDPYTLFQCVLGICGETLTVKFLQSDFRLDFRKFRVIFAIFFAVDFW